MAFWDTLKKVAGYATNPIGTLVAPLMKEAYGTQLPAAIKMARTNYTTPAVTTAEQRAKMQAPAPKPITPTNYVGGGGGGGGGVYGANLPSYESTRGMAEGKVSGAYDPLRKLLEQEMNDKIPERYEKQIKTQKERLPLNQRKYESLLSLLEQSTEESKSDIRAQGESATGAAAARAAARGLYDSSVLAGSEQRISKDVMEALTEAEKNKQLKAEGYNVDYGLADQSVYEALANLYNQQEGAISDVKSRLYGIPADMLGSVENIIGGVANYGKAGADMWNTYNSGGGSSNKPVAQEYTDPVTGEVKVGFFQNGQLISDPLQAAGGTAGERTQTALYSLLKKALEDQSVSQEELNDLYQRFPAEAENIDSLVAPYMKKQPTLIQRLLGMQ